MKQLCKFEIDIPEGYEFVRIGTPKKGDYVFSANLIPMNICLDFSYGTYVILKKKFVWPSWVKSGTWLVKLGDENDSWILCKEQPRKILDSEIWGIYGRFTYVKNINECNNEPLIPPSNVKSEDSLMQKP